MSVATLTGRVLLLVVAVVCSLLSGWYGGKAAWADAQSVSSRWLVNQWRDGAGPPASPELWNQTLNELHRALTLTPDNPQLFDDIGFLYASRGQAFGTPERNTPAHTYQQALFRQAYESYHAATRLRPTFPYSWLYLALVSHLQGRHDDTFWLAFDNAVLYGSSEAAAQPTLAQIAFGNWATLTAPRQARIVAMVMTAQPRAAKQMRALALQVGVQLPTSAAL